MLPYPFDYKRIQQMALTKAEKSRAYRERKAAKGMKPKTVWLSEVVIDIISEYMQVVNSDQTQSEIIEDILMTWACDTAEVMPELKRREEKREASK